MQVIYLLRVYTMTFQVEETDSTLGWAVFSSMSRSGGATISKAFDNQTIVQWYTVLQCYYSVITLVIASMVLGTILSRLAQHLVPPFDVWPIQGATCLIQSFRCFQTAAGSGGTHEGWQIQDGQAEAPTWEA